MHPSAQSINLGDKNCGAHNKAVISIMIEIEKSDRKRKIILNQKKLILAQIGCKL